MNKSIESRDKRMKVSGAIVVMKSMGFSENDIIDRITESFQVTRDYVLALMESQVA